MDLNLCDFYFCTFVMRYLLNIVMRNLHLSFDIYLCFGFRTFACPAPVEAFLGHVVPVEGRLGWGTRPIIDQRPVGTGCVDVTAVAGLVVTVWQPLAAPDAAPPSRTTLRTLIPLQFLRSLFTGLLDLRIFFLLHKANKFKHDCLQWE